MSFELEKGVDDMGIWKRMISLAISGMMLCAMTPSIISGGILTASAEFDYTNADNYTADCLSQGLISLETGTATTDPVVYNSAFSHDYTYVRLANELLDSPGTLIASQTWTNWSDFFSGDFRGITQEETYETMLLSYLQYDVTATNQQEDLVSKAAENMNDILHNVLNITETVGDVSAELPQEILSKLDIDTVSTLCENAGVVRNIKKYTKIVDEVSGAATDVGDYLKAVSTALALKEVDENRVNYLMAMKAAASDNPDICNSIDNILDTMQTSAQEIAVDEALKSGADFGISKAWSAFKNGTGLFGEAELGMETLDLIFNNDDMASNNIKLALMYTMNEYGKQALNTMNYNYKMDGSQENAKALNAGFSSYLAYQEYATDWARTFVSDATNEGLKNWLKKLLSDENEELYDYYMSEFDSDIRFCEQEMGFLEKWRSIYEKLNANEGKTDLESMGDELGNSADSNSYYVIFYEGYRKGRLEMSTFEADEQCKIIWNKNLVCSSQIGKCNQYYYSNGNWISIGTYRILTDWALDIVTSNVDIYNSAGTLLKEKNNDNIQNICGNSAAYSFNNTTGELTIIGIGSVENSWIDISDRIVNVNINDRITTIGADTFEDCTSLETIIIPNSILTIGPHAFDNCVSLENVTIPESVTSIGKNAFKDCTSLSSIIIENPDCEIAVGVGTLQEDAVIYGHTNSTAQSYAEKYGRAFISLDEEVTTTEITTTTTTAEITTTETTTTETTAVTTTAATAHPITDILYGDVNLDGKVDLSDVVHLNKFISGSVQLNELAATNADCNCDGTRSAEDSMVLLQFLVHLIDTLPDAG